MHSLTGNARFQIGNQAPIPIGDTPAPLGRVVAKPGATVVQTTGPDPKMMVFRTGQLTAPADPRAVGVFPWNSKIFQVATAITVSLPNVQATLRKSGRTGAPTVTWCPGQVVSPSGNPACLTPDAGPGIPGIVRYTRTAAQFGGPMQGHFAGFASVAHRVDGTPPGTVTAAFALATPFPTGAQGGPFGFKISNSGAPPPPPPNGIGGFLAAANGTLVGPPLWQDPTASGWTDAATSYGAPWTTGRITLSFSRGSGPPSIFTFTGADARVDGVGTISLVSGAISARTLTSGSANRGWLNLTVGPRSIPTPAVSRGVLAAAFGLFALAGGCALRDRRRMS